MSRADQRRRRRRTTTPSASPTPPASVVAPLPSTVATRQPQPPDDGVYPRPAPPPPSYVVGMPPSCVASGSSPALPDAAPASGVALPGATQRPSTHDVPARQSTASSVASAWQWTSCPFGRHESWVVGASLGLATQNADTQ